MSVAAVSGSAPREVGAFMDVSAAGAHGSIGGGALEHLAISRAREMLTQNALVDLDEISLGPSLGQCCGGKVRLSFGWAPRQDAAPSHPTIHIFGAGHVGAALARALRPLPFRTRLYDQRQDWLDAAPDGVAQVLAALPEAEVAAAGPGEGFVVLTHDHALDFQIVEAALRRGDAGYVGMIGSSTKRARLMSVLAKAGVNAETLVCPIGASDVRDKRPEVIAAMTAAEIAAAFL